MTHHLTIHSKIKLRNGVEMPIFGLGTYLAQFESVLYAIKEANYILLDTAEYYENEAGVGHAVRASGLKRENLFVTTKIFTTEGGRESVIRTVENSLKIMNIGYIDQYLLHAPQGGCVLEAYDVLLEYEKKGLIKSVGVSNFGVAHLEAIKKSGRPLPVVNQIQLHPWSTNQEIVDWCKSNNVAIVGYCPLTRGTKFSDPLVLHLSKKYNKTPAQILIRWSLQKGYVTIPKSSKYERIKQNADVFNFNIDDADMAKFEEIKQNNSNSENVDENITWDPTKNELENDFGPTEL